MKQVPRTYSLSEAAQLCDVQRETLKRWIKAGRAPKPTVRIGHYWAFAAAEMDAFADRLRSAASGISGLEIRIFDMAPEQADEAREVERRLSLALWAVGQLVQLPADGGAAAALNQASLCLDLVEVGACIDGAIPGDLESVHYYAAQDSAVIRTGLHAGDFEAQRLAAMAVHLVLSVANNDEAINTIKREAEAGTPDAVRLVETLRQLRLAIGAYLAESQNPYSAGTLQGS